MARTVRLGRGCLILGVALLVLGLSPAEAAYRLTFQNGTSVEVQSYEDLGDAIRYPRLGGVVVVPKSSVSAIEEAVHLPPLTPPAPAPRAPTTAPPSVTQGVHETVRPPLNPPARMSSERGVVGPTALSLQVDEQIKLGRVLRDEAPCKLACL